MIEVIDAAPDTLLTTLATVKSILGITDNAQDANLTSMIGAASDFATRYCGREFAKQTIKESIIGKGMPEILLSLTPIISVTTVEFDDAAVDDWVMYDDKAGIIQRRAKFTSTQFPSASIDYAPSSYGEKRWHVTYVGGYVLPGWTGQGTRTLPYDLERAIVDMVKAQVASAKFSGTMKSYKIGDTSITWDTGSSETANVSALVPNSALAVLNYYRRAF
jgi:hypothetical protein